MGSFRILGLGFRPGDVHELVVRLRGYLQFWLLADGNPSLFRGTEGKDPSLGSETVKTALELKLPDLQAFKQARGSDRHDSFVHRQLIELNNICNSCKHELQLGVYRRD